MKKGKLLILIILIAALVAGAVAIVKIRQKEDLEAKKPTLYPIHVKTVALKKGHVITTLPYLALVKNDKNVLISSKFAGRVLFVKDLGSEVKKGEVVLKIDDSALKSKLVNINSSISSVKSAIEAQEINLLNLKKMYNRTKELYKAKLASLSDLENLQNKLAILNSQIKANKEKLKSLIASKKEILNEMSYAVIKSPIDGIVSKKMVNIGDNVAPLKPALEIASKNGNYLFVALSYSPKEIIYKGKIYKLIPLNSTFNGLKTFKANVEDNDLLSGEKVDVNIVTFDGNATLVPFDALLSIDNKNFVFTPKPVEINVIAKGVEGVVTNTPLPSRVIKANPDILLKIKAGYPVKIGD